MPGPYSSQGSLRDARDLARRLKLRYAEIPIGPVFEAYRSTLRDHLEGKAPLTEENLQARIRGSILMALSNRFGHLVLSTGNKSELAVGYCTLYGDMAGGYALLSDVPKTLVYALAREINRDKEWIPAASITKEPSAEPKRRRLAAAVFTARPADRGAGGSLTARASGGPPREGLDGPCARDRHSARPKRVQAAADASRPQGHRSGLRRRAPLPHRAEVSGLMRANRAVS